MNLHKAQHLHFIGIGGIGISAIAKWALEQGKQVSGSDLKENVTTQWLAAHGARVHIGTHKAENVPAGCDMVVHTVSVHPGNPEYDIATERALPIATYPQALNVILAGKQGIAVAGTHGKSTTTALLAYILVEAQRDPTVVVGTRVRLFGDTNERLGKGPDLLIEADEYNQGILLYQPQHAVVLNVDHEHVDIYPTLADLQHAFQTFVSHVPTSGTVTLNAEDASTLLLQQVSRAPVRTFGLQAGDLRASDSKTITGGQSFSVSGLYNGPLTTQLYGEHNVRNILAALCVAQALHIPFDVCQKAVAAFPGTWRRFENRGTWKGATIIDDYAHHPTEIQATLQATRQAFPHQRIICVFQPHLHSRTLAFAKQFSAVLALADVCIVLEVYDVDGRSENTHMSSKTIAQAIGPNAQFVENVQAAVEHVAQIVQPGDIILTLGAGDITTFFDLAIKNIPKR